MRCVRADRRAMVLSPSVHKFIMTFSTLMAKAYIGGQNSKCQREDLARGAYARVVDKWLRGRINPRKNQISYIKRAIRNAMIDEADYQSRRKMMPVDQESIVCSDLLADVEFRAAIAKYPALSALLSTAVSGGRLTISIAVVREIEQAQSEGLLPPLPIQRSPR